MLARLLASCSVASWFGLGSWQWIAWLKKRLFGSRSGWLLAVATKHTKQERPSPVSERRSCCLAKSSEFAFRTLNGSFEASGCWACQASQAAPNPCSVGPSSRIGRPRIRLCNQCVGRRPALTSVESRIASGMLNDESGSALPNFIRSPAADGPI